MERYSSVRKVYVLGGADENSDNRPERFQRSRLVIRDTNDDFSRIISYSRIQNDLVDVTRELANLVDQLSEYRETAPSLTIVQTYLPTMLAQLMRSRERAKRTYRAVLDATFQDEVAWNLQEQLFHDLEKELFRTNEFLSLYSGRGVYH